MSAAAVVASLVLALSGAVNTAVGSHSLPSDPTYWDCNVDGFADDTCVRGYRAGTGWNSARIARFNEAFAEWSGDTDFDPVASTTGQAVYVNNNGCVADWSPYPFVILAAVCVSKVWRLDSYYRLTGTYTYFNPVLADVGLSWWTGAGAPNPNTIHFGGTLVHELGHWVYLKDLGCAAGVTMCNTSESEMDTFDQFSLETDDKNAANSVYP